MLVFKEFFAMTHYEPSRTFIKNYLHLIHADAWSAASEKMEPGLKHQLVKMRRKLRKNQRIEFHKKPKNGALDRI